MADLTIKKKLEEGCKQWLISGNKLLFSQLSLLCPCLCQHISQFGSFKDRNCRAAGFLGETAGNRVQCRTKVYELEYGRCVAVLLMGQSPCLLQLWYLDTFSSLLKMATQGGTPQVPAVARQQPPESLLQLTPIPACFSALWMVHFCQLLKLVSRDGWAKYSGCCFSAF